MMTASLRKLKFMSQTISQPLAAHRGCQPQWSQVRRPPCLTAERSHRSRRLAGADAHALHACSTHSQTLASPRRAPVLRRSASRAGCQATRRGHTDQT